MSICFMVSVSAFQMKYKKKKLIMLIVYFTFHYFIIYLLKMLYFLYNFINYQILWCISKNTFILCKSFSWLWVMFAILLTSFYWTNLLHIYSISDQFQRRNIDDWTNAFQYARKKYWHVMSNRCKWKELAN